MKLHLQTASQSPPCCRRSPCSLLVLPFVPLDLLSFCSAITIHCFRPFTIITIPSLRRCAVTKPWLSSQKQYKRLSPSCSSNFQHLNRDPRISPHQQHRHVRPPPSQELQFPRSTRQLDPHIRKHISTMPHSRPSRHHPRGRQDLRRKAEGVQRANCRAEQEEGAKSVRAIPQSPSPSSFFLAYRSHCSTCEHCEISFF